MQQYIQFIAIRIYVNIKNIQIIFVYGIYAMRQENIEIPNFDGLVQDRSISIADALEIL